MRYTEDKTMSEYIDKLQALRNSPEGMDSAVSESMQMAILQAIFGATGDSKYVPVFSALQTMEEANRTWEKTTARLLQYYSTEKALERNSLSEPKLGQ